MGEKDGKRLPSAVRCSREGAWVGVSKGQRVGQRERRHSFGGGVMEAVEFFDAVKDALRETESSTPIGCDFFISDMEELFEEWKQGSKERKR